jgi:pyruvate formate-lyase activating enzyme-like uncharacterized protein
MVKPTRHGSYLVGDLPEGCRLCTLGAKLVLFVTGRCGRSCYYCPLSPERMGVDRIFANERPVTKDVEIVEEARLMDALGTGLTGGDPMIVPDRTLGLLSMLKSEFGGDHHVHLYTAKSRLSTSILTKLHEAGLDELRFHATTRHGDVMRRAVDIGLNVGVEIPSIPGTSKDMEEIALLADSCGVNFLNLNELEMCETTSEAFGKRNLKVVGGNSMAVMGSIEEALGIAEFCEANTSLDVHVCPSGLKDSVQLKNRLGRRAERVRKPYESIDEDNLLVKAVVTPLANLSKIQMERLARELRKDLDLDFEMLEFNEEKGRLETLPELAEEISVMVNGGDFEVAIIEEYPTWDRFETERIPISR